MAVPRPGELLNQRLWANSERRVLGNTWNINSPLEAPVTMASLPSRTRFAIIFDVFWVLEEWLLLMHSSVESFWSMFIKAPSSQLQGLRGSPNTPQEFLFPLFPASRGERVMGRYQRASCH